MESSIPRSKSFDSASSSQTIKRSLEQVLKQHDDLRRSQEGTETAPPRQSNTNLVSWSGANDKENPQNFSNMTKLSIGINVSMMNLIVSFAVSVVSSMLGQIAIDFEQHDLEEMQLAVTVYIAGLAFGPVFFGPASECYGRKKPLVLGMTGFFVFNYLVTAVNGLRIALICRFLSAACGSAAYVIPPGVFVDLYGPVGRAIGYQVFATAAFVGGSVGPGVAAYMISSGLQWRWPLYLVSITTFPMILASILLPETLESALLQHKARRLRFATGEWSWHAKKDESPLELSNYLVKPWKMLVQEPVLIVVTMAFTIAYFIQTLTCSEIPIAFGKRHWDYTAAYQSLFLTLPGFTLGCAILIVDTILRFRKRHVKGLPIAPESRLPPMIVGMALLSIGLLWFAYSCSPDTNWPLQAAAAIVFSCGMYMVWVTATVYVQDLYVSHSNSALAACAFVRYSVGAAAPMLSGMLREKVGLRRTITFVGIFCAFLVPLHIFFYFFGKKIRRLSRFALHDAYVETPGAL
ncbi:hypothetical protein CKM354_001005000 [Cercospora kikuchii]|uniref:Major facilitator superfamily (MFS) profile domain-containing protein n=1 Tax=Cercospora kikuchii TaxID=84275 RepID=A0A9P3CPG9_9PEZI|nr:uncharacterized protein CKM354_001005000 [Cercospora kikuchii]GIZ46947.1 hypothetical protein CKM354_001005000 [Cercospora kikuchii]